MTEEQTWHPPPRDIRERYRFTTERVERGPGTWDATRVTVLSGDKVLAQYERNYAMLRTFEPFAQWDGKRWHPYALLSPEYTRTSVMDLETGEAIAVEEEKYYDDERTRPGAGFCPVEFHVPSWWDAHDGSILPGHKYWRDEYRLPDGTSGFVSGCHWGDDNSWKVQHLDLSRIREGKVLRDDRFGYLELPSRTSLKEAVHLSSDGQEVEIAVGLRFSMSTGEIDEDSREGLLDSQWRSWRRPGETS